MKKLKNTMGYFLGGLLLLAGTAGSAQADSKYVTYNFTGTTTFVSGIPFGLSPAIGAPVKGSFTYDVNQSPTSSTGTAAFYNYQLPPISMSVSVIISGVPVTFQSQDPSNTGTSMHQFSVLNETGVGVDQFLGRFLPISVNGVLQNNFSDIGFRLTDFTQRALSSTALPLLCEEIIDANNNKKPRYEFFRTEADLRNVMTGAVGDAANGGLLRFSIDTIECDETIEVTIDIKPKTSPNDINPKSQGVIPVAILTTNTFDATTVDSRTVLFGATGTEAAPAQSALEDVDGDGDIDILLHFNTQDTGIKCENTDASLTGETFYGDAIEGLDTIKIVGCKS